MPKLCVRSLLLAGVTVVAPSLAISSAVSASPGDGAHAEVTELQAGGRKVAGDGGASLQSFLTPRFTGDTRWTAVSGHVSSTVRELGQQSNTHAIRSFSWFEKADRPCYFTVVQSSEPFGLDWSMPPMDAPGRKGVSVCENYNGQSQLEVARAGGEGVSAIAICLNDKKVSDKERLKGIRLWGRRVDASTKQLTVENGPSEARRNNCADWQTKVSCNGDELVASVRLHYGYDGNNGFVRGIQLGCRKVIVP